MRLNTEEINIIREEDKEEKVVVKYKLVQIGKNVLWS